ncbi:MAG: chromosomal replication initiator protein DnaA [Bacilli bacterium]|jgi:chromosomal replication initiator protein|nr:chromosomal replication initiator protein DnaA [Bacilli bacterium]
MTSNLSQVWTNTLELIKKELGDDIAFNAYYKNTFFNDVNNNIVNIIVEDYLAREYLNTNRDFIEDNFNIITESNFKLNFILADDLNKEKNDNDDIQSNNLNVPLTNLKKDLTFESFVVGPSNEQAYKAAIAASTNPGNIFNPLFLYGDSGLGKTHLMHSIGNSIVKNKPNMRILYVTSDEFLSDYLFLSREPSTENNDYFNNKYRNLDVLLIDDIQFLQKKEKTNEMFFNIYNNLFNHNKQVVITADVNPSKLNGLTNRLVSRFNQGLSISITPPNFETSINILKNKLSFFDETGEAIISDEALKFIATHFSKDVRELEGALRTLLFQLINSESNLIDLKIIHQTFKDFNFDYQNKELTSELIQECVCNYYNLSKSQITSKSRVNKIVIPRHIAIYLDRILLETPYEKIGKLYGNRDHSTIMSSFNFVKKKIEANDNDFKVAISEITKLCKTT